MLQPIKVEARPGYRIWLEYDDGVCGELDLSHLVGKGVFKVWEEPGHFEKAHIDEHGAIAWDENIDICEYALYIDITGKSAEEVMPGLKPIVQRQNAQPQPLPPHKAQVYDGHSRPPLRPCVKNSLG